MRNTPAPLISVIIPCYNEEQVLPILIERVEAAASTWECRHEVICVNDGSTDSTWEILKHQARLMPNWRAYSFSRNFGQQAAIAAGLQRAQGDASVIIDADMQDPPEAIIKLIEEWRKGSEVVYGVRESRQDPVIKNLLAWAFYRIQSKISPTPLAKDSGEFALLDRKAVNAINQLPERSRYQRGLRSWIGFKQKSVLFHRDSRAAGQPKYSFLKSLRLAMDGIFAFSTVPLRLALWLGCLTLLVATLCTLGLILGDGGILTLRSRLPWLAILFLSGTQLLCLGLAGEYLARIFEEAKARPLYLISESTAVDESR